MVARPLSFSPSEPGTVIRVVKNMVEDNKDVRPKHLAKKSEPGHEIRLMNCNSFHLQNVNQAETATNVDFVPTMP